MKTSLWNKHIENTLFVEKVVLEKDNKNIKAFFCADVVGNRRFAQNYGGYPRSDIAEINAQTDLAAAKALLNDLQMIPVSNDNSGLSDAEIMLGHRSRYCQTPSEQIDWLEGQLQIRDAKRSASISADVSVPTIKFEENSNSDE